MRTYCKILNNETGLVQLGIGCSDEYYIEIGMTIHDVTQSEKDNQWYLTDKCPHYTTEEQAERTKQKRINELKGQLNDIDNKKIRPTSAIVLGVDTEYDHTKLQQLEAQAEIIRQELQSL